MATTLSQKHPLKGTREFRLVDDEIQYTITYGNNGPDTGDLTITESYPT